MHSLPVKIKCDGCINPLFPFIQNHTKQTKVNQIQTAFLVKCKDSMVTQAIFKSKLMIFDDFTFSIVYPKENVIKSAKRQKHIKDRMKALINFDLDSILVIYFPNFQGIDIQAFSKSGEMSFQMHVAHLAYNQKMHYKLFLLTLLLLTVAAQQDEAIDSSAQVSATATDADDKPQSAPLKTQPEISAEKSIEIARPPGETKRLSSNLIIPLKFVTYTVNIFTYCPNTVWLWVYASSWFKISYGSYTSGWYAPWTWHQIAITPNCQCTTVRIQVFNWWGQPTWISYGTWQSTWNCFNCGTDGVKYFNFQTCRCTCKRNCCIPSWYYVNQKTCQCQPREIVPSLSIDSKLTSASGGN